MRHCFVLNVVALNTRTLYIATEMPSIYSKMTIAQFPICHTTSDLWTLPLCQIYYDKSNLNRSPGDVNLVENGQFADVSITFQYSSSSKCKWYKPFSYIAPSSDFIQMRQNQKVKFSIVVRTWWLDCTDLALKTNSGMYSKRRKLYVVYIRPRLGLAYTLLMLMTCVDLRNLLLKTQWTIHNLMFIILLSTV